MELTQIIILICAAVIVLLQVITLLSVRGMKASLEALRQSGRPSAVPQQAQQSQGNRFERGGRRDGSNQQRRPDRRPQEQQQQRRPEQQRPAQSATPAEKSLRDINLRLKNAERDQEQTRRRMQEGAGSEQGRGPEGRGNRDGRGGRGRGGRDRGLRRDGREGGDRGGQERRPEVQRDDVLPVAERPREELRPEPEVRPVEERPVAQPVSQVPELTPSDFPAGEGLEHGRKIMVKRRPLGNVEDQPREKSDEVASEPPAAIEFGRRKR